MSKNTKLTFSPIIYRDWTVIFSTLIYQAFTVEFAQQFGFRYTDTMYVWDGRIVTIYRAIEEHRDQMFKLLQKRLSENPDFVEQITTDTIRDMNTFHPYFLDLLQQDFSVLKPPQLRKLFEIYRQHVLEAFPRFAITMYFPQQVELFGLRQKYQQEFDMAVEARAKVHQVLTPMGNIIAGKFADNALRQIGVLRDLARYLAVDELEQCWNKTEPPELEHTLQQRKKYWMIAGKKVTREPVRRYIQRQGWTLKIPAIHHNRELPGRTVYGAGNITGFVRVVPNQGALIKVHKHDIIVAPMITPEYSSILPMVKGIVTDEGGITSHAAILSREMKIPAIVGTAIASRVLKDGDEIELDTDKGVVQVIRLAH